MRLRIHFHYRFIAALFGVALALLCVRSKASEPLPAIISSEGSFEDLLPIHRVYLHGDLLAAGLRGLEKGTFVRLERAEFEGRVRKAAIAMQSRTPTPR